MANLLQVRRGNEGIIQVSEDAYNSVYKGAGFNIVPSTTQTTVAPTTTIKAAPGTTVNTLPTSVLPDPNRQTTANRVATPAYTVNSQGQSIASTQALSADPSQVTANASLTQQDRLLGPTEYNNLRTSLGVSEANFDQYFRRDGANIYLKAGAMSGMAKPPAQLAGIPGSTTKTLDASVLSNTSDQGLDFPTTDTTDFSAWINSLLNLTKSPELTALEQQQGTMLTDLQTSYDKFKTMGDFSRQKEAELGITSDTAALKEINLQIAQKIGEYQQTQQNISQQPISQGLLIGQSAALQRQAAIDVGVLQGQAEALRGNLELSYGLLDRAIAMEFEPIEKQIEATKFFLEQNKEQMSKEESKQAFKIEQMLKFREEAVTNAKAEKERVRDLMLAVAQAGGDPRIIDFNKSFEENLITASPFLQGSGDAKRDTSWQEIGGVKTLVDNQTGEVIKELKPDLTGSVSYSSEQIKAINDLVTQQRSDNDISTFAVVRDAYNQILNGAKSTRENPDQQGPGDLSIIYGYVKMIDPTSSVKEGEIQSVNLAKGAVDGFNDQINKIKNGGNLGSQREVYVNAARGIYENKRNAYQNKVDFYGNLADIQNIRREDAIWDVVGTKTIDRQIDELRSLGRTPEEIVGAIGQADSNFSFVLSHGREQGKTDDQIIDEYYEYRFGQTFDGSQVAASGVMPVITDITVPSLGSLSSQFEGGVDSIGYDSTGGWSYGKFQITQGNIPKFMRALSTINPLLASAFNGVQAGTKAFNDAWKMVASKDKSAFEAAQNTWVKSQYFDPVYENLSTTTGVDFEKYSPVLKQVLWSTSVQHGPAGAVSIISSALKALGKNAPEDTLIKKIYALRWSDGANFKSSTDKVKEAVKKRLINETTEALSRLKKYFG